MILMSPFLLLFAILTLGETVHAIPEKLEEVSKNNTGYVFINPELAKSILKKYDVYKPIPEKTLFDGYPYHGARKFWKKPYLIPDPEYCERVRDYFISHPNEI